MGLSTEKRKNAPFPRIGQVRRKEKKRKRGFDHNAREVIKKGRERKARRGKDKGVCDIRNEFFVFSVRTNTAIHFQSLKIPIQ